MSLVAGSNNTLVLIRCAYHIKSVLRRAINVLSDDFKFHHFRNIEFCSILSQHSTIMSFLFYFIGLHSLIVELTSMFGKFIGDDSNRNCLYAQISHRIIILLYCLKNRKNRIINSQRLQKNRKKVRTEDEIGFDMV